MLLFNNAIVFFPKNSSEHAAATALRGVVSKEIEKTIPKQHRPPAPLPAKEPTTPPRPLIKPKSEPAISLNGKPGSTGPIIACRKRSSISAKANPAVAAEMKKKEVAADVERKAEAAAAKEADDASVNVAAERVTKKRTMERTMERTGGAARGTRTSKTRSSNASNVGGGGRGSSGNPNSNPSPSSGGGGGAAAKAESSETKAEKKNATNSGVAKKRSAANFLSRVKRSLSSNGTLLDSLKGSSVGGNSNGRGSTTEQKKGGGGGKSEGRRDQGQRQGSNGKQQASAAEQSSGKRSVGRPPKRAAATPPSKRRKETTEAEAKAPARKRARR